MNLKIESLPTKLEELTCLPIFLLYALLLYQCSYPLTNPWMLFQMSNYTFTKASSDCDFVNYYLYAYDHRDHIKLEGACGPKSEVAFDPDLELFIQARLFCRLLFPVWWVTLNSKKTGTIPANCILKPSWRRWHVGQFAGHPNPLRDKTRNLL